MEKIGLNDIRNEIIDFVHSKEAKNYLYDNYNEISNLQWASLVLNFIKNDRIKFLVNLRDRTQSEYEKELFNHAINDFKKYGYISEETENYYSKKDPRGNNKPEFVFEEKIDFPIVYNFGDVVTYEDNINEYYIVGLRPNITSESDLSDYDYLCYSINNSVNCDGDLFSAHAHLCACQMNKTDINILPSNIKDNIANAIKVIKNNDLYKANYLKMK